MKITASIERYKCIQYRQQQAVKSLIFFFNDTATTEIYTLSLHDALPILLLSLRYKELYRGVEDFYLLKEADRKSTRLNSSHLYQSRMPSSA